MVRLQLLCNGTTGATTLYNARLLLQHTWHWNGSACSREGMALGDEPNQVNNGQTVDTTNGVVRRKRGRPRKHPLPDAAGTSKVAKNTGDRDNGIATVPTNNKKKQAGESGPNEALFHQSCTDELLESLLEESPTIPLGTSINGNQGKNYSLNKQHVSLAMNNAPSYSLQHMQREIYRGLNLETDGEPFPRSEEETGRENQQRAGGQNEPQLEGKGAARPAGVDFIGNLQEYQKQSRCQDDITRRQISNKNETSQHPVDSSSSKLTSAVNHLKAVLWQSQHFSEEDNNQGNCAGQACDQMLCTYRKSPNADQKNRKVGTENCNQVQVQEWADPLSKDAVTVVQDVHNQGEQSNQQEFLQNCFSQEIASFQKGMQDDTGERENSHRSNLSEKDGAERDDGRRKDVYRQDESQKKWNGQEYCADALQQFQASGHEAPSRTSVSLVSLLGEENVKALLSPSERQTPSESSNSLMLLLKTAARLEIELQKTSRQLEVQGELYQQQQIHVDKLEALYTGVLEENKRLREVLEYRRDIDRNATRRGAERGVLYEDPTYLRRNPDRNMFIPGISHSVYNRPGSVTEARGRCLPPFPNEAYL